MKKSLIYSAIVLLFASMACNKTETLVSGDEMIRFAPATESTRALIEDNTDLQAVTFRVYDYLDNAEYINDQISYDSDAEPNQWVYASETGKTKGYLWKTGTHKLFGYTASLPALSSNKVTYTATVTASANQNDLLYSDLVSTTAKAWKETEDNTKTTPVKLNMKHLFAAVSFSVVNNKTAAITMNDVTLPTIQTSYTATINYGGTAVAVSYAAAESQSDFITAETKTDVALAAGAQMDLLTQTVATPTFFVVWPQTFAATTVTVHYTYQERSYEATISLPEVAWANGKKYEYKLIIGDVDDILLNFTVKDWETGATEEYVFE